MTQERHTDRRRFLVGSAAAAAITVSGGALMHSGEAWGLEVKNLKPETMQTLIKMARDLFPHDKVADRFYAVAVKGFDEKAGTSTETKKMIEEGITNLNSLARQKFGVAYGQMGWEAERVNVLKLIRTSSFFKTVRGTLVVSLYNQKELWPLFGYEGESASKGGYVNRGFNDITWL